MASSSLPPALTEDTGRNGNDGVASRQINTLAQPSSSSRSAVFRNPDIMEMVFNALSDHAKPAAKSQNLLHAALTSKEFLNPAMNVLWRSLTSLLPILNLIPSFEIIANERDANRPYYTTSSHIIEDDLTRVDVYSRRVRHLTLLNQSGENEHQRIASHIYFSLHELRRFRLFPALKSFTAPTLDQLLPDDLQVLLLVPSPTLSTVSLSGIDRISEVYVTTFLNQLCGLNSKSLMNLTLWGKQTTNCLLVLQKSKTLSQLSLCLNDIQDIGNLLVAVSRNAGLVQLALDCRSAKDSHSKLALKKPAIIAPPNTFVAERLERIRTIGYMQSISAIVDAIIKYAPNMVSLILEICLDDSSSPHFAALKQCLKGVKKNAASLVFLTIVNVHHPMYAFNWSTLECIDNWTSLRHLKVLIPVVGLESDESIDPLVWPFASLNSLEALTFQVDIWEQNGSKLPDTNVTVLTLPQIARCCPQLKYLRIYIPPKLLADDGVLDKMERELEDMRAAHQNPSPIFVPHGLKKLSFLGSRSSKVPKAITPNISRAVGVAEYLSLVFPNLTKVNFKAGALELDKDWTDTITTILTRFKPRPST
ncbi:hypothetical protein HYPSUDRAFT_40223 [Hypholoma sublateritium FD-334 SS-4]|uniref:F-box domain-containing protein n=1 Tax=Hypholoma sublateritium (strain FD-334 SS-4) TaxID=945553 RepID=A0A0D2MHG9_HYPSF|nr:hypothetical protein HYPSUDRAFT_40223 [Hypholoma sublateritium FD-334 SS-4]